MDEQHFPLGIAAGESFLGREAETHQLIHNINQGRHTLLLSPRRYGKTSLARHVIRSHKCIFSEIDLFLAIDEYAIEARFINCIESLIPAISTKKKKWFELLLNFFKNADKTWTIGFKGVSLELRPGNHKDIAGNLLDLLNALEFMLFKQQKKVVLFVDEFQEINKLKTGKAIEGAIRHFAQASRYVVFIFSGSSRHILQDIFGNRSRPLYKLCDWIVLSRLDQSLYRDYLNKIAQKTWRQPLEKETFDEIIALSECHPEAIYALCGGLWLLATDQQVPDKSVVQRAWKEYVTEHLKQTRQMLSTSSPGQLKLLILISRGFTQVLTGKEVQAKLNVTSPSIAKALQVLEAEDFIEKDAQNAYRIIDPVIKATLLDFYSDYLRE